MAAYLHAQIDVTDPVLYEEYRRRVPAVIAAHGGRYLVRGGAATLLEGEGPPPLREVVLEFPDMAALLGFYRAPEYQPLIALRQRCSRGRIVAIEGYSAA